uniref:Uncharacterized protein n=1 Tax=Arundo donax TaxID=35708 RepID=A0A0A9EAY2_ARUDO
MKKLEQFWRKNQGLLCIPPW